MSALLKALQKSQAYDEHKLDFTVPINQITYNDQAQMVLPPDDFGQLAPMSMTDWALGQVCTKLGDPPKRYLGRCPGWLAGLQLNHWQEEKGKEVGESTRMAKNWFVRSYQGQVRATLTDKYTPINNTELIQIVYDLAKEANLHGKLVRPYVSADRLDLKMIVDDRDGGNWGIGAYIGNGEIGNRLIVVNPLVQKYSCTNSTIIAQGGFTHKHIHTTKETLHTLLLAAIGNAFKVADAMMDNVMIAERQKLPNLKDVLIKLRKDNGFSEEFEEYALMGAGAQGNVMAVIDGVTYAAHKTPGMSQDDRIKAEEVAGAILAAPDDLFGYTARMGELMEREND